MNILNELKGKYIYVYIKQILTNTLGVCVFSCCGGLRAARTEASHRRPVVQQQGGRALYEGGQELLPG